MRKFVHKKEYLEKLISLVQSDKKVVLAQIVFCVLLPLHTFKELVTGGLDWLTTGDSMSKTIVWGLATINILAFTGAALFLFAYYRRLHLNEYALAKKFLEEDVQGARNLMFGKKNSLWSRHGWKYVTGEWAFYVGIATYLIILILVISHPLFG
ncbi:MAG: hypothetical protein ACYSW0_21095 [Planctomycetota bacterium]